MRVLGAYPSGVALRSQLMNPHEIEYTVHRRDSPGNEFYGAIRAETPAEAAQEAAAIVGDLGWTSWELRIRGTDSVVAWTSAAETDVAVVVADLAEPHAAR
jgi:hypothetical protein